VIRLLPSIRRPAAPATAPRRTSTDHPFTTAAEFYDTPKGRLATTLLTDRLAPLLPPSTGRRILGLGYTRPYLAPLAQTGARTLSARLNQIPMTGTQNARRDFDCTVDERTLPFDDLCMDAVLAIHALEFAKDPKDLLRAAWKVMADDGHLILVLPSRTGFWAQSESTPFGFGTPFSVRQIERLLADAMFRAETITGALALPPLGLTLKRRPARMIDRIAHLARLSGVHIIIARKDIYAALPLTPARGIRALKRRIMEPA